MDTYYDEIGFSQYEETFEPPEWGFNYLSVTHDDMLNGDGLRVVLWVAGCSHGCPDCQNAYSWDKNFGREFTEETWDEIYSHLSKDYIQGITFSGGDPLFVSNRKPLGVLAKQIKRYFPNKDLWVYTGYELAYDTANGFFFREAAPWKDVKDEFCLDWFDSIDVLVDGPFLRDIRKQDLRLGNDPMWVGSSNQRVIDVPRTIDTRMIIRKEEK